MTDIGSDHALAQRDRFSLSSGVRRLSCIFTVPSAGIPSVALNFPLQVTLFHVYLPITTFNLNNLQVKIIVQREHHKLPDKVEIAF